MLPQISHSGPQFPCLTFKADSSTHPEADFSKAYVHMEHLLNPGETWRGQWL